MTRESIEALSDSELGLMSGWVQAEQRARAERHKQQTLAKIRELARSIEVGVRIEGTRGRPRKAKMEAEAGNEK